MIYSVRWAGGMPGLYVNPLWMAVTLRMYWHECHDYVGDATLRDKHQNNGENWKLDLHIIGPALTGGVAGVLYKA